MNIHMKRITCILTFSLLVFSLVDTTPAEEKEKPKEDSKSNKKANKDANQDDLEVTHHTINLNGQEIKYTATAGTYAIKSDDGKHKASMFSIAYTKDDVKDPSTRPVTFVFNGGPGSSSVWLHMGLVGPQRVPINDDATASAPPFQSIKNDYSLIDLTDLVMIDPVSTGYSRPAPGEKKQEFHGYYEDIKSVGEFIHLYIKRNNRWQSPLFLMGESYGTLRAAGLSGHLFERYKIYLNGMILVSSVVDFQTILFHTNNHLPHIMFFPGYSATAWYHNKLSKDLQQKPLKEVVQQARDFAENEYALALLKGTRLPDEKFDAVAKRYAQLSGLSFEYVKAARLKVTMPRFSKELLRDQGLTVGRFDSRFTGIDRDAVGERSEYDPSGSALMGPYTATYQDYLWSDLQVKKDQVYEILTRNVHPWSFKPFQNRYVDASETLRQTMVQNPAMKVFLACGYYDLATPFFAAEYLADQLSLPKNFRENVTFGYYEAGHMMYVYTPALKQMKKDLTEYYQSAIPEK